jgi:hypothetical protein
VSGFIAPVRLRLQGNGSERSGKFSPQVTAENSQAWKVT